MKKETISTGDAYDFASLREKIRNAWGKKEKSANSEAGKKKFAESFDEVQKDATIANKNRKIKNAAMRAAALKDGRTLTVNTFDGPDLRPAGKVSGKSRLNEWISDRASKWVLYETVFGPPRSRKPWKPVR